MIPRLPALLRLGPARLRRLRTHLGDADRAMRTADWATAAAHYTAALAIDPARWPLRVQLGHALKEQGFLGRAEVAYREALDRQPTRADTHLQLGHVLKLQGRRREAAGAYASAVRLDPGHADARRELDHIGPEPDEEVDPAERELLRQADLSPVLLPLFDEVFYVNANAVVRRDLPAPNRMACLAHFCATGLEAVLPFNADLVFDPVFYAATALGRSLPPTASYRHWLTLGLATGQAANRDDWLRLRCGIGPQRTATLSEATRATLFALERAGGSWVDLFDETRAAGGFAPGAPERGALLGAFADRAARFSRDDARERSMASRLDNRILSIEPTHAGTLARVAEHLRRDGHVAEAMARDAALVTSAHPSVAATLGLADGLEAVGAPETALDTLAAGRRLFVGDTRLDRAFERIATALLHRAFRLALASAAPDAEADAALSAAVAHVIRLDAPGATLPTRPIRRVAIVGDGTLPQCRLYRLTGKLEQFAAAGIPATFFDVHSEIPRFLDALHEFDTVLFYRVAAGYAVIAAIHRCRALGITTIYETDDLLFDAAHYPDTLASYGGSIDTREHRGLRLGVPLMAAALRLCDVGLASTPTLAAAMAPLVRTGRGFVHRNALGRAHAVAVARPMPPHDSERVTLFYGSGTKAHATDFSDILEPTLVELVRRHGAAIRIVLAGHVPATDALSRVGAVVERHPALPLDAYWALLAEADIALAVLSPSPMADAKSEIKWLEAAMFGIPAVVSDTATYREAIEPGVTGFLCRTRDEWVATLDRLVTDPALRRTVGERARAVARERYGEAASARGLADILATPSPPAPPKKPKLLIVNVFYPPQLIGGATRVVRDNVRTLIADGSFDVAVYASTDGGGAPHTLSTSAQEGVRVTAATIAPRADIDRLLDEPAMGEAFGRYLDVDPPDLIHFHCVQRLTIAVVEAARSRSIPYLITAHDGWWVSDRQFIVDRFGTPALYDYADPAATARRLGPAAAARMARLAPALRDAQRVLAVSASFAAVYEAAGVQNVLAVPNGLSGDIGGLRPSSPGGPLRLGFVGGMEDHKGWGLVQTVLKAGDFAGFELTVVDHNQPVGEERTTLFGATPVRFIPRVPPEAIRTLYDGLDILLAPSLWPESFGLVAREAIACGVWVVASDRGAVAEDVVEGANGFVVDVSSPEGLAAVLHRIAVDADRYRTPPAHRTALRTAEMQGRDLAALYRTLLRVAPLDPPHPGVSYPSPS